MYSITEPRRVTVSCKHIFSTFTNDRSTTTTNQRLFSFSIINNNYSSSSDSNDIIYCYCEKENLSYRKRHRRYYKKSSYENCQTKRIKTYSRTKNRQQRFNTSLIKFSIDLTGQNIDYTIEYHHNTIISPFYYEYYYISWLEIYYYLYFYYLQIFNRECEEKLLAIFFFSIEKIDFKIEYF
jgi:hypothetical protein